MDHRGREVYVKAEPCEEGKAFTEHMGHPAESGCPQHGTF